MAGQHGAVLGVLGVGLDVGDQVVEQDGLRKQRAGRGAGRREVGAVWAPPGDRGPRSGGSLATAPASAQRVAPWRLCTVLVTTHGDEVQVLGQVLLGHLGGGQQGVERGVDGCEDGAASEGGRGEGGRLHKRAACDGECGRAAGLQTRARQRRRPRSPVPGSQHVGGAGHLHKLHLHRVRRAAEAG